jgi:hypothetical protein
MSRKMIIKRPMITSVGRGPNSGVFTLEMIYRQGLIPRFETLNNTSGHDRMGPVALFFHANKKVMGKRTVPKERIGSSRGVKNIRARQTV